MDRIIQEINGKIIEYGIKTNKNNYTYYNYLTFKEKNNTIKKFTNVVINENIHKELNNAISFKILETSKLNKLYSINVISGLQSKNKKIYIDIKLLNFFYKTRIFFAYISLIPPFTIISYWLFKKAKKIKLELDNIDKF